MPPLHCEDGGSMGLRNIGILPYHYMESEDLDLNLHSRENFKRHVVMNFAGGGVIACS